jgi:hypothetical protein
MHDGEFNEKLQIAMNLLRNKMKIIDSSFLNCCQLRKNKKQNWDRNFQYAEPSKDEINN